MSAEQKNPGPGYKRVDNALVYGASKSAMPLVGLGTWKIPKDKAAAQVEQAIKLGYRHLDCAENYGNEKEVGQGIANAIKAGICKREDLFITSKLWNTNHAREHVRPACERTLRELGLTYLDLYLIHFPIAFTHVDPKDRYPIDFNPVITGHQEPITYQETWEAMEGLVEAGLAKNIGVSNLNFPYLMELLKYAKIHPVTNQIEHHPLLQQPKLIKWCQERGISITAYSSFGVASYVELGADRATGDLLKHPVVTRLAEKYKKTPAQILLRWAVQRDVIVIPKSSNPERLKQNMDVFSFAISDEDMETIALMDTGKRFNDPGDFWKCPIWW